jgi:serine/threonine-protein kinase
MMLHQVLDEEPRPPRRLADDVPRDLETVCLKAMAKEPSGRYQTAAALAEDLRRFLRGQPVRARPVGPLGRLRRWCRRQPMAAALVLVTAIGFAAVTWQWRRAEIHLDEAQRHRRQAVDNFHQAHQLVNDVVHLGASPMFQSRVATPLRREMMEVCLKYYQSFLWEHGDDPTLREEATRYRLRSASFLYSLTVDRKAAKSEALRACAQGRLAWQELLAADPTNEAYRDELAWIDAWEGEVHFDQEEFAQARQCFVRTRDYYQGRVEAGSASTKQRNALALACQRLGIVQRRLKRSAEACQALKQALAHYQVLLETDALTDARLAALSKTYYHLGEELRQMGREAESLEATQHVIALSDAPLLKGVVDNDLLWVQGRSYYAIAKSKEEGQPRQAIPYFERAAEFYQRQVRVNPPGEAALGELGNCYQHLGDLHQRLGNLLEAILYYEKALPIREQRWQKDPWLGRREALVRTCWNLGQALEQLGRPNEALAVYLRAVDPRRVVPKEGKPEERRHLRELYRNVAESLRRLGRSAEGERVTRQEEDLGANRAAGK